MIITRGFIELLRNDCSVCDKNTENPDRLEGSEDCNAVTEQECFTRIHLLLEKAKELRK
jgi:hypothetical protein